MKKKELKLALREARAELSGLQLWVDANKPNLHLNKDGFEENKRLKARLAEVERHRDQKHEDFKRAAARVTELSNALAQAEKAQTLLTEERDAARRALEEKATEGPCGACQERERVAMEECSRLRVELVTVRERSVSAERVGELTHALNEAREETQKLAAWKADNEDARANLNGMVGREGQAIRNSVQMREERDAARGERDERVAALEAATARIHKATDERDKALESARLSSEVQKKHEVEDRAEIVRLKNDLEYMTRQCHALKEEKAMLVEELTVVVKARKSAEACYAALLKANHDREKLGGAVSITAHPAVDATTGHLLSPLQASQVLPPEKSVMQTIAEKVHEDEQARRAAREYPPKCRHGHPMKTVRSPRPGYVRDVPECSVCDPEKEFGVDYKPRTDDERQLLESA